MEFISYLIVGAGGCLVGFWVVGGLVFGLWLYISAYKQEEE